jgi:hypothetical protein
MGKYLNIGQHSGISNVYIILMSKWNCGELKTGNLGNLTAFHTTLPDIPKIN